MPGGIIPGGIPGGNGMPGLGGIPKGGIGIPGLGGIIGGMPGGIIPGIIGGIPGGGNPGGNPRFPSRSDFTSIGGRPDLITGGGPGGNPGSVFDGDIPGGRNI